VSAFAHQERAEPLSDASTACEPRTSDSRDARSYVLSYSSYQPCFSRARVAHEQQDKVMPRNGTKPAITTIASSDVFASATARIGFKTCQSRLTHRRGRRSARPAKPEAHRTAVPRSAGSDAANLLLVIVVPRRLPADQGCDSVGPYSCFLYSIPCRVGLSRPHG
jgi:hypothetical protein